MLGEFFFCVGNKFSSFQILIRWFYVPLSSYSRSRKACLIFRRKISVDFLFPPESYLKQPQTSTLEHFPTIINRFLSLAILAKLSILDICGSSRYASGFMVNMIKTSKVLRY